MQQTLARRTWLSTPSVGVDSPARRAEAPAGGNSLQEPRLDVKSMVRENAVILVGRRGCCMCHAMKRLLLMLGVNPAVHDVDEKDEERVVGELCGVDRDERPEFPSVFIGGRLFGGLDRLMSAHISGDLVPKLKQAGALWL